MRVNQAKRGQSLTIFLVLGMVLLAAFGMVFFVRNAMKAELAEPLTLDTATISLKNQVDICIKQVVDEGLEYYGILPDSEAALKAWLEREVPRCVDTGFYEQQGFSVTEQAFTALVRISDDAVVIDAQYPLVIADSTGKSNLEEFGHSVPRIASEFVVLDEDGATVDEVTVVTADSSAQLFVPAGTRITDSSGEPVTRIEVKLKDKTEGGYENALIPGEVIYDLLPDGVTFDPAVTLTIVYNPRLVIGSETGLSIAYFDAETEMWQSVPSVVDTFRNTVSAELTHFSYRAVIRDCVAPALSELPWEILYLEPCYRSCGMSSNRNNLDSWDKCWKAVDENGDLAIWATPDMTDVLLRSVDWVARADADSLEKLAELDFEGSESGEVSLCQEDFPIMSQGDGSFQLGVDPSGLGEGDEIAFTRFEDQQDRRDKINSFFTDFGIDARDWDETGQPGIPNEQCFAQSNILDWDKDDQYENLCVCVKNDGTECSAEIKAIFEGTWQNTCTGEVQDAAEGYYKDNYQDVQAFSWLISQYSEDLMNKDGIVDGQKDDTGGSLAGDKWEGGCACTVQTHEVETGDYDVFWDPITETRIKSVAPKTLGDNPMDEDATDYGEVSTPNFYGYTSYDGPGGEGDEYTYNLRSGGNTCQQEGQHSEIHVVCENECVVSAYSRRLREWVVLEGSCIGSCVVSNLVEAAGQNRVRVVVKNYEDNVCAHAYVAKVTMYSGSGILPFCPQCTPVDERCTCGVQIADVGQYCIGTQVKTYYDEGFCDAVHRPCPECLEMDSSYEGCFCGSNPEPKGPGDNFCVDDVFYGRERDVEEFCDDIIAECPPCIPLNFECRCGQEVYEGDGQYCQNGVLVDEEPPECTITGDFCDLRRNKCCFNSEYCVEGTGNFHWVSCFDGDAYPLSIFTGISPRANGCSPAAGCSAEHVAPPPKVTGSRGDRVDAVSGSAWADAIAEMERQSEGRDCGQGGGGEEPPGERDCKGGCDDGNACTVGDKWRWQNENCVCGGNQRNTCECGGECAPPDPCDKCHGNSKACCNQGCPQHSNCQSSGGGQGGGNQGGGNEGGGQGGGNQGGGNEGGGQGGGNQGGGQGGGNQGGGNEGGGQGGGNQGGGQGGGKKNDG